MKAGDGGGADPDKSARGEAVSDPAKLLAVALDLLDRALAASLHERRDLLRRMGLLPAPR